MQPARHSMLVRRRSESCGSGSRFAQGTPPHVKPIHQWQPNFPSGHIEAVYLHWSGNDYSTVFASYHYCIALIDGEVVVAHTHSLTENMRDVSSGGEYAAHTYGRNSYAAGVSIMGMEGATPQDFGPYPLTTGLIDGMCRVAAAIVSAYAIPIDHTHVLTHAEAAVADGYFGTGNDERWDIARLNPHPSPLDPGDAATAGDELRRRIALVRS